MAQPIAVSKPVRRVAEATERLQEFSTQEMYREILTRLGEDPNRDGLVATPSRVEKASTSCVVMHFYAWNDERQVQKREKASTYCAITRYTSGKGHLPLDRGAMQPKGIIVTIRTGGEELLML